MAMMPSSKHIERACQCIAEGDTDPAPPPGCDPGAWRKLILGLVRGGVGAYKGGTAGRGWAGCATPSLHRRIDENGCYTEEKYCEVPQTVIVPAGTAGAVTGLQIVTQSEAYIVRMVATSVTRADVDAVNLSNASNKGNLYLPNGAVNLGAYAIEASTNVFESNVKLTSSQPVNLTFNRLATTTSPVNVTFTIDEVR